MGVVLTIVDVAKSSGLPRILHREFVCEMATVGSDEGNDVHLPGEQMSPRHARFHCRAGRIAVVRLGRGIDVNGKAVTVRSHELKHGDVVSVGGYDIRIDPDVLEIASGAGGSDRTRERELLEALEKDPSSSDIREVYGDWLEENGRVVEAELLAIEAMLSTMEVARVGSALAERKKKRADLEARRRELASQLPGDLWKCLLTRPPIESCTNTSRNEPCPATWDRLKATPDEPRIRRCTVCSKNVYYVTSMRQVTRRRTRQDRMAIDVTTKPQT